MNWNSNRADGRRSINRASLICWLLIQATGPGVFANERLAKEPVPPSPSNLGTANSPDMSNTDSASGRPNPDRPVSSLNASIRHNEGELPSNLAAPHLAAEGTFFDMVGHGRPWMVSQYEWDAPATRHLPLYFEEPNLERMGYTCCCNPHCTECESCWWQEDYVQPFVSAIHFYGQVAIVPIRVFCEPPAEPVYTLGVDRPGSPVCYRSHLLPFGLKRICQQGDDLWR